MAKRGRPKLKAAQRRGETIHLRVSSGELKVIETAAKAAGEGVSDWARNALLRAAGVDRVTEGMGIEPRGGISTAI